MGIAADATPRTQWSTRRRRRKDFFRNATELSFIVSGFLTGVRPVTRNLKWIQFSHNCINTFPSRRKPFYRFAGTAFIPPLACIYTAYNCCKKSLRANVAARLRVPPASMFQPTFLESERERLVHRRSYRKQSLYSQACPALGLVML
jgi:hypothetical protein